MKTSDASSSILTMIQANKRMLLASIQHAFPRCRSALQIGWFRSAPNSLRPTLPTIPPLRAGEPRSAHAPLPTRRVRINDPAPTVIEWGWSDGVGRIHRCVRRYHPRSRSARSTTGALIAGATGTHRCRNTHHRGGSRWDRTKVAHPQMVAFPLLNPLKKSASRQWKQSRHDQQRKTNSAHVSISLKGPSQRPKHSSSSWKVSAEICANLRVWQTFLRQIAGYFRETVLNSSPAKKPLVPTSFSQVVASSTTSSARMPRNR